MHPISHVQSIYRKRLNDSYIHLQSPYHRFEQARNIHEKLSKLLGNKLTFFARNHDEKIESSISSLDVVAYAFLKEELNNTPESKEV